jgi:hypothetical protein
LLLKSRGERGILTLLKDLKVELSEAMTTVVANHCTSVEFVMDYVQLRFDRSGNPDV